MQSNFKTQSIHNFHPSSCQLPWVELVVLIIFGVGEKNLQKYNSNSIHALGGIHGTQAHLQLMVICNKGGRLCESRHDSYRTLHLIMCTVEDVYSLRIFAYH